MVHRRGRARRRAEAFFGPLLGWARPLAWTGGAAAGVFFALLLAQPAQATPITGANADFDKVCVNPGQDLLESLAGLQDRTTQAKSVTTNDVELGDDIASAGYDPAYFGMNEPFPKLVAHITTAGLNGQLTWQYNKNGNVWTDLSGVSVSGPSTHFTVAGVHTVTWTIPTDWAERDLGSACPGTFYWVRARTTDTYNANKIPYAARISAVEYNVEVRVRDELGNALGGLSQPAFLVSGGTNNTISAWREHVTDTGNYQLALNTTGATHSYNINVTKDAYVRSAAVNTGSVTTTMTVINPTLAFAFKVTSVSTEGPGTSLTGVTVKAGNGQTTTCTASGGAWYCAVPLSDTTLTIQAVKDGYVTDTGSSFATDRTQNWHAQVLGTVSSMKFAYKVHTVTTEGPGTSLSGVDVDAGNSQGTQCTEFNADWYCAVPVGDSTLTIRATKDGYKENSGSSFGQDRASNGAPQEHGNVTGLIFAYKVTSITTEDDVALTDPTVSAGDGATIGCTMHTGFAYCAVPIGHTALGIQVARDGYVTHTSTSFATDRTAHTQDQVTQSVTGVLYAYVMQFWTEYNVTGIQFEKRINGGSWGVVSPSADASNQAFFAQSPSESNVDYRVTKYGVTVSAGPAFTTNTIDQRLQIVQIVSVLTNLSTEADSYAAGAETTLRFTFTASHAWHVVGNPYVVFPSGYVNNGNAATITGGVSDTAVLAGTWPTMWAGRYGGGGTTAEGATFTVAYNIVNPTQAGSTGTFSLELQTSALVKQDAGTAPSVTIVPAALASIDVTPATLGVSAGTTGHDFGATGADQYGNAITLNPTWSATCGSVTSPDGVYTAPTATGTCTVTATQDAISDSATVTVNPGPLASITVSPAAPNVTVATNQTFTATGADQYGNGVTVAPNWTASCGSITAGGVFTAGTTVTTCTITAMEGSVNGTATVNVVAGALATITVNPSNPSVQVTASQAFSASGADAYGNAVAVTVTWSASCGSITGGGSYTAPNATGSCTVTATQDSVSGSTTVTVTPGPLTSLTVTPDAGSVAAGNNLSFTASGVDQYGNAVSASPSWSSSCGSITGAGVFTAPTLVQSCTVTATVDAVSDGATVNVVVGPLATITVAPATASLQVDAQQQFTATGDDQYGNDVSVSPTWAATCGSITGAGLYTAPTTTGTCIANATQSGIVGEATITVTPGALASMSLNPASASVAAGGTQAFTATGADQYGNAISVAPTWSATCGSITQAGSYAAPTTTGTCTVEAVQSDITASATVTVVAGSLSQIILSPANPTIATGGTRAFSATGADAHGNPVALDTPTWSTTCGWITKARVYKAPPFVNTCQVRATQDGITGSSTVTISGGWPAKISASGGATINGVAVNTTKTLRVLVQTAANKPVAGISVDWALTSGTATLASSTSTTGADGVASVNAVGGTVPGSFVVRAATTDLPGKYVDLTVNTVAGAPVTIDVNPATATVTAGYTQSFTSSGQDAYANTATFTPTWTTTCGTITGGGVFKAATTLGTCTVTARKGAAEDTATVTVAANTATQMSASGSTTFNAVTVNTFKTLKILAQDANRVAVYDVPISWEITQGAATLSADSTTTDPTGATSITATVGTTAGTVRIQASGAGLTGSPVTFTLNTVGGSAASITVTPNAASVEAGYTQSFTASGQDAYGNTITPKPTWTATCGTITGAGVYTAPSVPGTCTVTGRVGPSTSNATVTVDPITGTRMAANGGASFTGVAVQATKALRVIVTDPNLKPVYGLTVDWSVVEGDGSLDASTSATDTRGIAGVTLTTGTTAGVIRVQASYGSLQGSPVNYTVTSVAGPPVSITMSPQAPTLVAGYTQTFTASGVDAFGNPAIVRPAWTTTCGTITGLGFFKAPAIPDVCTVTARQGSASDSTDVAVDPATATQMAASGASSFTNVVVNTSKTLKVLVKDAGNMPVYDVAVDWSVADGGGSLSASTTNTDSKGFASVTLTTGTAVGENRVEATVNGLTGSPVTFTVTTVAGAAAQITVSPASASVDAGYSVTFTASGVDAFSNPVMPKPTWTASCGTVTSLGAYTAPTTPGTCTVTARKGAAEDTATVTVDPVAATAVVASGPTSFTGVTVNTAKVIKVLVRDPSSVPVYDVPVDWIVTQGSATLSAAQTSTAANGIATVTVTMGTAVESIQVEASSPDVPSSNVAFTFAAVAGAPVSLSLSPSSATLTAGYTETFTATGEDAYGNVFAVAPSWSATCGSITSAGVYKAPQTANSCVVRATRGAAVDTADVTVDGNTPTRIVASGASSFTNVAVTTSKVVKVLVTDDNSVPVQGVPITWSLPDGNGFFEASSTTTGTDGTTSTTYWAGQNAGTLRVRATSPSIGGAVLDFNVTLVGGAPVSLTVAPDPVSVTAGYTTTLTVSGEDDYGNTVSVSSPTWTAACGTITSAGLYRGPTTPGPCVVTATKSGVSDTVTVTVTANTATKMAASGGSTFTGVAVNSGKQLKVLVQDDNNVAVYGVSVSWTITAGGGSLSAASTSTDANGFATVTLTTGTTAGLNQVQGAVAGLTGSPVTFNVTTVAGALASVTVNPGSVTLSPSQTQSFTVSGSDAYGNPVTVSSPTWTATCGTITGAGAYTAPSTTGSCTVTATKSGISDTADVTVA